MGSTGTLPASDPTASPRSAIATRSASFNRVGRFVFALRLVPSEPPSDHA